MTSRLYKAAWIEGDAGKNYDDEIDDHSAALDPAGWAEYAEEMFGEYRPFFFPSTGRIYRSRSAAQRRVDMINYWGGRAEVLECTPVWHSVEVANLQRERSRVEARIAKLESSIEAERAKLAQSRPLRRPAHIDEQLRAMDD